VANVHAYMRPLLDLVEAGRLHPERVISHRLRLDQVEEAYRLFDRREATKVVLTP
jgi:threonine dehydrogenase-like Zn-dependent dehydrogenase